MATITVTWQAFNSDDPKRLQDFADAGRLPVTSKTIEVSSADGVDHPQLCEFLFRDTNTYSGSFWTLLQPLPEKRTHTAMSVGDEVTIDGRTYRCMDIGFAEVIECPNHEGAFDCTPFCSLCEGEQEVLDRATVNN